MFFFFSICTGKEKNFSNRIHDFIQLHAEPACLKVCVWVRKLCLLSVVQLPEHITFIITCLPLSASARLSFMLRASAPLCAIFLEGDFSCLIKFWRKSFILKRAILSQWSLNNRFWHAGKWNFNFLPLNGCRVWSDVRTCRHVAVKFLFSQF